MVDISAHFISLLHYYGGLGVFIGLILEFIGLPLPGEAINSFLGYLSYSAGGYALLINIIYATSGSLIGSIFSYFIGLKYGERVLLKLGKYIHLNETKLNSAKELFNRRRVLFLLFGRFIPGIRVFVSYLSGISGLKFGTYLFYTFMSTATWCTTFICLGYALGDNWSVIETIFRTYFVIFILLVIFAFIVLKYFNNHKKSIFAISLPLFLFVKLCEDLISKEFSIFDNVVYGYISQIINPIMTEFMKIISAFGSGFVLVTISLLCLIAFWKNEKYSLYSKMIGINLVAVSIANEIFKQIFHRGRPDILRLIDISGFSFPSGHSMVGLSFYGFIAYLFYKNLKSKWRYMIVFILSLLILLIGISRVYLGVHYSSDVVAGFSAGLAWLAAFITIVKMSEK